MTEHLDEKAHTGTRSTNPSARIREVAPDLPPDVEVRLAQLMDDYAEERVETAVRAALRATEPKGPLT